MEDQILIKCEVCTQGWLVPTEGVSSSSGHPHTCSNCDGNFLLDVVTTGLPQKIELEYPVIKLVGNYDDQMSAGLCQCYFVLWTFKELKINSIIRSPGGQLCQVMERTDFRRKDADQRGFLFYCKILANELDILIPAQHLNENQTWNLIQE